MRAGVVVFPGTNCEHDVVHALGTLGVETELVWHREADLTGLDGIVLPGGFAHGDYLRTGAIARFSPVIGGIRALAERGGPVLGICNGFQVLCEAGLLPGALTRNEGLRFIHRRQHLRVEADCAWTAGITPGEVLDLPLKHGEGRYVHDNIDGLAASGQILARYCHPDGTVDDEANPNGSRGNIAGVTNSAGNVAGLMPHPEHAVDPLLGPTDGARLLRAVLSRATVAG